MKNLVTIILLGGIVGLASCLGNNKAEQTPNYLPIPKADSVSKGSAMTITFGADTFNVNDWTVSGNPAEYLYGDQIFNVNDSFWTSRIIVTDYRLAAFSMDLNTVNTTNPYYLDTGNYYVTTNTSTITDYSSGENKTYNVLIGSYIHLTSTYYPVIGTMSLNLYYDHTTTYATGNFIIYK